MTARHRWARLPAVTFAAIVVMLTAALAAPVQAKAQTPAPPGNIVTFGDSYTASPDQWLNGIAASSVPSSSASEEYPQTGGCLQSPYNWPRQLAAQTGLEVADWSCTADTTAGMLDRIDRAIGAGDISPDTQAVIFAIGGNDFGPAGVLEGAPLSSVPGMVDRYAQNMQEAADKVRAVAPEAHLVISGYPQVTNGTGLCFIQVLPEQPLGVPFPGELVERSLRDMQRHAADATGMSFVDNYELTEGHDTCSPDDALRYVSGILDVTSPAYEMIMHPTGLGHSAIAANNAAALGLPSEEPEALDDLTSADLSSALSSLSSGSSESPTPIG
ncbi:GDSL-type esterase/lipase family protein [Corynebacterium maris]|nr:GDSL-type esterase/lipase family protein [Corynebacterium maris]